MTKRYDNIQILRVAACLGVFLCHLASLTGLGGLPGKIANFGASGVYLFFMISGFLACRAGTFESKTLYYRKRALRILPQYYLILLYEFLLHTLVLRDVPADPAHLGWTRYLFLLSAFLPTPSNFWGNLALTWTVPLFVFFYLLAPWIVPRFAKGREVSLPVSPLSQEQGKKRDTERLWGLCLYPLTLAVKYIWLRIGPEGSLSGFYYLHFFALGIAVWQFCRMPKRKAAGYFLIYAGSIAVLLRILAGEIDYFTAVSWGFALVTLVTCDFRWPEENAAEDHAGRRMIAAVDKHSYDIYLVHGVVFEALTILKPRLPGGIAMTLLLAFMMCGLTAAGAVIMHRVCGRITDTLSRS